MWNLKLVQEAEEALRRYDGAEFMTSKHRVDMYPITTEEAKERIEQHKRDFMKGGQTRKGYDRRHDRKMAGETEFVMISDGTSFTEAETIIAKTEVSDNFTAEKRNTNGITKLMVMKGSYTRFHQNLM